MISKGFKLTKVDGQYVLINKYGSKDQTHWEFKQPTFSFVEDLGGGIGDFRCKQIGDVVGFKFIPSCDRPQPLWGRTHG